LLILTLLLFRILKALGPKICHSWKICDCPVVQATARTGEQDRMTADAIAVVGALPWKCPREG
jgi:hypothetical protein